MCKGEGQSGRLNALVLLGASCGEDTPLLSDPLPPFYL